MHSSTKFILKIIAVAVLFVVSLRGVASAQALPEALLARAESIVTLVNQGKFSSVASQMHYPPGWTSEQRAADQASVADGLKLLGSRLGKLADCKPFTGTAVAYEVLAGGGDIEYWAGVSPFRTEDVSYVGRFEGFGRGFLKVRFAEIKSKWAVQVIIFSFDATVPGARDKAIDTMTAVYRHGLERDGQPVPGNLRELIASQTPDLSRLAQPPQPRVD